MQNIADTVVFHIKFLNSAADLVVDKEVVSTVFSYFPVDHLGS